MNAAEQKMTKAYSQYRSTVLVNRPAYEEAHEPHPCRSKVWTKTAVDVHVLRLGVKLSSG